MTNIIQITPRLESKARRLKYVVGLILASNQSLIVGTANPQLRYEELQIMFPDAKLEIVKFGIKICNRKK